MSHDEVFERMAASVLASMRNQIAVLACEIVQYHNEIKYWSEAVDLYPDDPECRLLLQVTKRQLETALQRRERYRVRIAKYEGFDIVRPDVH